MKILRQGILFLLCLLLLPTVSVRADENELRITPPAGREDAVGYLTDGNMETRLTLESQKSVVAEWDAKDAVTVLISWYEPAAEILIEVLDEKGATAVRKVEKNTPYRQQVNVTSGCALRITSLKGSCSISELTLYHVGQAIPYAESVPFQADLLIICAGVTEETRILSGLIPYYAGQHNLRTAIVYIRRDYGYMVGEAFDALSVLGYSENPVFMLRDDQNVTTEERVKKYWKTSLNSELWNVIRKVDPKIIVTLDPNDKTQPARTRTVSKIVREVVLSYTKRIQIGLQKLYILNSAGTTTLDWSVPLSKFGGRTAHDVAEEALQQYKSQQLYRYTVPETSSFELIYTTVGQDKAGNDLLENIDTNSLISYEDPEEEPQLVPVAGALSEPRGPKGGLGVLAAAGLLALCCALLKKKRAFAAVALALVFTVCGTAARADTEHENDPDDIYYRQPGEPEEVIVSDYPDGHWEYRSDTLSVIIDREKFQTDGHPQCIYVAYIRSRDVDCFHTGLSSSTDNDLLMMPWRMARTYGAVLAITGDNLINAEKSAKGILIRNGVFYSDYQAEDTLVVYSSQKIGLVKKGTIPGIQLLDSGIRNTFSFGPVLVEGGEVNPNVNKHRVAPGNPRCGIGIIKEGCLIAIVADGRDPSRAFNLTLDEFAELFKSRGATFAYNLDGGSSAAMVFMGESVSSHTGKAGQRTWIDALMFGYSDLVPDPGDKVTHWGEGDRY